MAELRIGVLGASSLVGRCVLPLLRTAGWQVTAYTRRAQPCDKLGVRWIMLPTELSEQQVCQDNAVMTPYWICAAPIWVLSDYFSFIEASGVQRLVVLSSTSCFTKAGSGDTAESAVAVKLIESETRLRAWAEQRGIEWVVLRPTLIYGMGQDKNISEIARFILRFGFFPLFGRAQGQRQPIHAEDVALACIAALQAPDAINRSYNLSGGETLAYRDMVARVFTALGRSKRLVTVPLWAFRLAVTMLRCLPRYRHWSGSMVERMNRNLVFDHTEAIGDLDFKPRGFALMAKDVPK